MLKFHSSPFQRLSSLGIPKRVRFYSARPKLIVLAGPTGVGKSFLASQLAKQLNGEIISVDSVKIYKGLDIGSNKLSVRKHTAALGIPVHLMDLKNVDEEFSTSEFKKMAIKLSDELRAKGKIPIFVGGSSFYMDTFFGQPTAPKRDELISNQVQKEVEADGSWEESLARLEAVDMESAKKLSKNDYFRLVRALEIYRQTGKPKSSFKATTNPLFEDWDVRAFYVTIPREPLYRGIDLRCEQMIRQGLLEETYHAFSGAEESPVAMAIGYREPLEYILKVKSKPFLIYDIGQFDTFLYEFQSHSRQLARQQLSWFRNSGIRKGKYLCVSIDDLETSLSNLLDFIALSAPDWQEKLATAPNKGICDLDKGHDQRTYQAQNKIFTKSPEGRKQKQIQMEKIQSFGDGISRRVFPIQERGIGRNK